MFRVFLISLILLGVLPVMADDVVVKRQKRNENTPPIKIENLAPKRLVSPKSKCVVSEQEIARNVKYIKQEIVKQSQKWLSLSDENLNKRLDEEFCRYKGYLISLGAQNVSFAVFYPNYFEDYKSFVIDGKTYKNPYKCAKFKFTYLGKPYESGYCRVSRPPNGIILVK